MSIYGDRGNIICLQKRCEWRGIKIEVKNISTVSTPYDLSLCDILVMGGSQDNQQLIVAKDLQKKKNALKEAIEKEIPGLYICGGFQYLGKYYKEANGNTIEQLGVLDIYTENPGKERLIGNIVVKLNPVIGNQTIVGFENHGGRTMLGQGIIPLGKVIKGFGSNSKEKLEGAIYKNTIGTYLHGPILPKNPEIADWLITKALEVKYKEKVTLEKLDDTLAKQARQWILKRVISTGN